MTDLLVRGIPAATHRELSRRAAQRGQSLQQFLSAELTRLASAPTVEDVLRRVSEQRGGRVGFGDAVDDLAQERSGP